MPPLQLTAAAKVATATVVNACLPTAAASPPPLNPPPTLPPPHRSPLPHCAASCTFAVSPHYRFLPLPSLPPGPAASSPCRRCLLLPRMSLTQRPSPPRAAHRNRDSRGARGGRPRASRQLGLWRRWRRRRRRRWGGRSRRCVNAEGGRGRSCRTSKKEGAKETTERFIWREET